MSARLSTADESDASDRPAGRAAWRNLPRAGAVLVACALALTAVVVLAVRSLGPPPQIDALDTSTVVLDRNGRLLRAYPTPDGRWRLPVRTDEVDPRFIAALVAYEDRRFYSHPGVDPLALVRAAFQFATHGRIVSGGSTLTMQVARLLEPRTERSLAAKFRQMARALELERRLSKSDILSLYLTLAPYGGNLEGVRAAALAYFGKEPRRLSPAEAALLVALPQSPEVRRPDRAPESARRMRDRVLERIASAGLLPADEAALAQREPVPSSRRPMPALAPHAADAVTSAEPAQKVHALTLDAPLQTALEELVREQVRTLGPELSAAVIAVDHARGAVLARVASADYFDERRSGQVDLTTALRSPGSALKPFIYGIGFEDGVIHPETLIDDRPVRFGSYAPENFDLTFQGTVSVRKALQLSLNVPAVTVLEAIRASRLTARIKTAGAGLILPKGETPGLAMGLGGVGITLADLTMLYAAIARGGEAVPLIERQSETDSPTRRLLTPEAAWYVGNVLVGTPPPENAAAGRIAFKTGTSYGYRDAWAVGFDGRHTVGVWVGRPDGAPVPGLTGRGAAAPLLFDAFARLGMPMPLPKAPKGVHLVANPKLPSPLQRFRPGTLVGDTRQRPLKIMFPPNGSLLEIARRDGRIEPIALKVAGGAAPISVLVNGLPIAADISGRNVLWSPEGPGFVRVTVMDSRGAADSVVIRLQ